MSVTTPNTYDIAPVEGVRRKRVTAFVIDFTVVCLLWILACVVIGVLGVLTLGLAWLLYGAVFPIVAVLYSGAGIASYGATMGMRGAGLRFQLDSGEKPGFLQGAMHVIAFYVSVTFLTPLILAVTFFNGRKRMLHDMLVGATIVNR